MSVVRLEYNAQRLGNKPLLNVSQRIFLNDQKLLQLLRQFSQGNEIKPIKYISDFIKTKSFFRESSGRALGLTSLASGDCSMNYNDEKLGLL